LLRVSAEVELKGLALPEMGAVGYSKDWEPSLEIAPEATRGALPAGASASAAD
jgi:hypothetical protein